jgi:hypothetical protein
MFRSLLAPAASTPVRAAGPEEQSTSAAPTRFGETLAPRDFRIFNLRFAAGCEVTIHLHAAGVAWLYAYDRDAVCLREAHGKGEIRLRFTPDSSGMHHVLLVNDSGGRLDYALTISEARASAR